VVGFGLFRQLACLAFVLLASAINFQMVRAQTFDGITIIDFPGAQGREAIADGDHIITFVSERGSYAAVATNFRGKRRGCIAAAVPGSYTGSSIKFGVEGDLGARRQGLSTLCPTFSLRFDGQNDVRVEAGPRYSREHRIVAHIPLRPIDFGAPHFMRHEVRGVRLGPVLNPDDLGPLPAKTYANSYAYKNFRHDVGVEAGKKRLVQGRAAPAEVTGWPWDVLYSANYYREYEQMNTIEGLRDAVIRQYGQPSSESTDRNYWVWLYDLDGNLVQPGSESDSCAITADYWLKYVPGGSVDHVNRNANMDDFGPWGCSLIMELNARGGSGGVKQYSVYMMSGYAMAMNHFFQQIEEPLAVMKQMQSHQYFKPRFD